MKLLNCFHIHLFPFLFLCYCAAMAAAAYVFGQIYFSYDEDRHWSEFGTKLETWAILADSDDPDQICDYIVAYMINRNATPVLPVRFPCVFGTSMDSLHWTDLCSFAPSPTFCKINAHAQTKDLANNPTKEAQLASPLLADMSV